jgi:CBS domain containing-hemolysin-like protein
MTTALGMIVLLLAILVRAGHEVIRSSGRIQLRHLVDERASGSLAARLHLEHPEYFRAALFSWENAIAISGALLVAAGSFAQRGPALLVSTTVIGAALFAAAASLAGSLARSSNARMLRALAPVVAPLLRVSAVMQPPLSKAEVSAEAAAKATDEGEREVVEELIAEGLREGIADREDMELVAGVVELRDTRVSEIMVKREDVFALPANLPVHEIANRIASSGYSRVPIYSGNLDVIVGIFHVLDVLKAGSHELPPLRPAVTADQAERCGDLLQRMLRQQSHICVVTNGSGHTAGIVTLEDLLEEIVGEIRDEFDEPAPATTTHGRQGTSVDMQRAQG